MVKQGVSEGKAVNANRRKKRVAVIFGGRSGEHEVSLASAASVISALDKEKYEVLPVGITKSGRWLTSGDSMKALKEGLTGTPQLPAADTTPSGSLVRREVSPATRELVPGICGESFPEVDVVFPVLHGPYGEDGTLQGLLELADVPYVGAGVAASALGMDKALMKAVFQAAGLPVADWLLVLRKDWVDHPDAILVQIENKLGYPCFTKPANLGSSVGVSKCQSRQELTRGMDDAGQYDRKIVVEWAVPNAREIECSVLGNDVAVASVLGEVIPCNEFYDYKAKYIDGRSELIIPADLPEESSNEIRRMAVLAYRLIDCAGMARVDFLVRGDTGEVFLSELNTIPGFTDISMYPKLWEASNLPYSELVDRLIELALERYEDKRRSKTSYVVEE